MQDGLKLQDTFTGLTPKTPPKPFWILSPDSSFLKGFSLFVNIMSLPISMMHLFVVAFGKEEAGATCVNITHVIEAFFGLEILLKFFTSFKDYETFQTVTSLKKIAQNYIVYGTFVLDIVAFFPFNMVFSGNNSK